MMNSKSEPLGILLAVLCSIGCAACHGTIAQTPTPSSDTQVLVQEVQPSKEGPMKGWRIDQKGEEKQLFFAKLKLQVPHPGPSFSPNSKLREHVCPSEDTPEVETCIALASENSDHGFVIEIDKIPEIAEELVPHLQKAMFGDDMTILNFQTMGTTEIGYESRVWLSPEEEGFLFIRVGYLRPPNSSQSYNVMIMELTTDIENLPPFELEDNLPEIQIDHPLMKIKRFVTPIYKTNCYVVWESESKEALIIDPGEIPQHIFEFTKSTQLVVKAIVQTHNHYDHTKGSAKLRELTGALIHRHPFRQQGEQADPNGEVLLAQGQKIRIGTLEFEVLHTPGHEPGSLCLFGEGVLFSGDLLFKGTVGRFDFPGGDEKLLRHSLNVVLSNVPDKTLVLPGHEEQTTMEEERLHNRFMVKTVGEEN